MTFDPYTWLRADPRVTAVWDAPMPDHGRWYERLQTMLVRGGLTQAARRCAVAHEGVHAERGDITCDPSVHREAARRLIPLGALADAAMFHADDFAAMAEELWVDEITLRTRLEHLHPSERGYLKRRLAMREETA